MKIIILLFTAFLILSGCASVPPGFTKIDNDDLSEIIDDIFQDTLFSHAHWGVLVESMSSGELIYEKNADRMFMPASNEKIPTSAAALTHLGPDFRFETVVGYSGNIEDGEGLQPVLEHNDLCSILQHRNSKKAVVVANGRQQVEEALAAGCDAIEQGYAMGEDNLRKMAARKVLWIPSLLRSKIALNTAAAGGDVGCRFSLGYVAPGKPDPGAKAFWEKMLSGQIKQLRFARKQGVITALGSGAGSVGILHGESMVEEMKLFIKAGYSMEETMRCASENGAGFFSMKTLGTLTVGSQATFLITRGSVKQLPRKLSYLEGIYVDGAPSTLYRKNPVRQA